MTVRVLLALTALGLFAALLGPVHTQEPGEPMVLSGRFELPSGDPAIGVKLELEVFRRVTRETERLSVVSDAQGRFELSVASGREFSRLEASKASNSIALRSSSGRLFIHEFRKFLQSPRDDHTGRVR